jgi:hypothetical protein
MRSATPIFDVLQRLALLETFTIRAQHNALRCASPLLWARRRFGARREWVTGDREAHNGCWRVRHGRQI